MPTVIGWTVLLALVLALVPHAVTTSAAAAAASGTKRRRVGRLINLLPSCDHAEAPVVLRCAERTWHRMPLPAGESPLCPDPRPGSVCRSAHRIPSRSDLSGRAQLDQLGLGLRTATDPVALLGSTWTKLAFFCHWKMNFCATVFSPELLNFTGPCTVCSVTPLCR